MSRRRHSKLREWLAELNRFDLNAIEMPRRVRKAVSKVYADERRRALSRQGRFECSMTSYDALFERLESSDKSTLLARLAKCRPDNATDFRPQETDRQ